MRKWLPIAVLSIAQFVMVIDGTVMNVSITTVVNDLNTTVSAMQVAIACFTLTMAALMLTGAAIGGRIGRRKTFVIGSIIYGAGSLLTALAANFEMLFVGWSIVEGIGAALVIPAVAALAAVNYQGRDRVIAYALLGGVAGAAAAMGPLIGGWVTAYFSWRWVFAAETLLILVIILPLAPFIKDLPVVSKQGKFDWLGAALSAAAMGTVVLALVSASSWGFIAPLYPPFTIVGLSPTIPVVLVGLGIGWAFLEWERRLKGSSRTPLLGVDLLGIARLRAGLASQMVLYFTIAGTFFVLPLYLQTVLNLDALESGIRMVPMSAAMFVTALVGSALASKFAPRRLIRLGLLTACFGLLLLISAITPLARGILFAIAMTLIGIGVGLAISQIGNVNLSSADESRSNEIGGLQGTAQNLGSSLGVALAGTALFIGLTSTFTTSVQSNSQIDAVVSEEVLAAVSSGVPVVSIDAAQDALSQAGVPDADAEQVVEEYADSKLRALRLGLAIVFLFALLALPLTRQLPNKPYSEEARAPSD